MSREKVNIIICCSAGMTSSFFLESLKSECQARGKTNITFLSATVADTISLPSDDVDIILVASQARYAKNALKEKLSKSIAIFDIEPQDYAVRNAKPIVDLLIEKKLI